MVTAAQLSRLDARLDALGAAIDTDSKPITVVVFQGESLRSQRHRELRPDHTGRLAWFEHRNDPRTEVAEMLAFHTPDVLQAKMDRIEAEDAGSRFCRECCGTRMGGTTRTTVPTILTNLRQRSVEPQLRHVLEGASGLLRQQTSCRWQIAERTSPDHNDGQSPATVQIS